MPYHNHSQPISDVTGGQTSNQPGYGGIKKFDEPVSYVGGGQVHNNLQPHITCYMWKRTA